MHGADSQSPQFERKQSEHPLAYLGTAREEPHLLAVSAARPGHIHRDIARASSAWRLQFQKTETFTDVSSCTGLTGTGVNTATTVGQFVDTGGTFHVHGTTVQVYRIDWSDGTCLLSRSPSHFEFNTNGLGQFVSTEVQQDPGILHNADGQVIGRLTVFTLSHMAWNDTNGNDRPDPGELTSSVDQFRVSCP